MKRVRIKQRKIAEQNNRNRRTERERKAGEDRTRINKGKTKELKTVGKEGKRKIREMEKKKLQRKGKIKNTRERK